jgi:hypothetical protein
MRGGGYVMSTMRGHGPLPQWWWSLQTPNKLVPDVCRSTRKPGHPHNLSPMFSRSGAPSHNARSSIITLQVFRLGIPNSHRKLHQRASWMCRSLHHIRRLSVNHNCHTGTSLPPPHY